MESRNVKVIDEHGIDRDANVICGVNVLGFDYVIYAIERDEENDNLFVSRIIKNIDGTFNMINIEDSIEKNNLSEIVKELVMLAVNKKGEKLVGNSITLNNGSNAIIFSVLFNKEQNINVTKTYITTVKKFVTSNTLEYYINNEENNNNFGSDEVSFFEQVNAIPDTDSFVAPSTEVQNTSDVVSPIPQINSSLNDDNDNQSLDAINFDVNSFPTLDLDNNQQINNTADVSDFINTDINKFPGFEENNDVLTNNNQGMSGFDFTPLNSNFSGDYDSINTSNLDNVTESINDVASAIPELTIPQPISSEELPIPVMNELPDKVEEFGEDDGTSQNSGFDDNNKNAGYASNKFFLVVAIIFFTVSCLFLGYEVFKYIQLR